MKNKIQGGEEKDLEVPLLLRREEVQPEVFLVYTLICVSLLIAGSILYRPRVYPEENPDVESEVNMLNKPPVQSFQTEYGDVFDCVDIYKQPAFDHSLLQNHTIQIRPTMFSNETDDRTGLIGINCPKQTVPIRRVTKEAIFAARSFKKFRFLESDIHATGLYSVMGKFYGAKATFNSWRPQVTKVYEYSTFHIDASSPYHRHEANFITAGWMVYPELFNDQHPRMFAYWTADSHQMTGCLDIYCSGFIQISKLPLGFPLPLISIYKDEAHQYDTTIHVFQDPITYNWWLRVEGQNIGYWPSELINKLANNGATHMFWGGQVCTPDGLGYSKGIEMGSGHCASEGYAKASYIRGVQYVPEVVSPHTFVDVPDTVASVGHVISSHFCATEMQHSSKWGSFFYYGGRQGTPC